MSRQYIGWALGGLVLLLSFLGTAFGDTEKKPPPPKTPANARAAHHPAVQVQRLIYVVKYGSAKDLAATLGNYFQADAEIQAASNSLGDYLLIRAPDPVAKEVVRVLEQLDRRPKVVSIEVVLVEVAPRKGEGAQPDAANKELDSREFSGEAGEVMARVESLRKEGRVVSLRRLQITTVENQSASIR
ncbi:MAG: hypothetical protein JO112_05265, partial [Planctomycetes bacterium]|nr:hypothetical protein [Planctomycetota bacterium]